MSKKLNSRFVLLVFFVVVFLSSCATSVGVRMLLPAKVDLGGKATIAVASTKPYNYYGWDSYTVADNASKTIFDALSAGVYNVVDSKQTQAIINGAKNLGLNPSKALLDKGAKILVQSSIDSMNFKDVYEIRQARDSKGRIERYEAYVRSDAELSLSIVVWDLQTESVIDVFNLRERAQSSIAEGRPNYLFSTILDKFSKTITSRYVPHYENIYVDLMSDKNLKDDKEVQDAISKVSDGDLALALPVFEAKWKSLSNTSCGYNACIIYYAIGQRDKALALADEVYQKTKNENVLTLIEELKSFEESEKLAKMQIEGLAKGQQESTKIQY